MRRILCIYLPNWPIQRLLAEREQEVRSRRVGPASGARADPPREKVAISPDRLSKKTTSVPRGSAVAEAPWTHPTPLIVPHDPTADLAALARLAEHCERFSPIVGWETVGERRRSSVLPASSSPPDFLLLDVTGIGILFGGEEQLAREVMAELARFGYDARVAIADTIGAAWALARVQGSGFSVQERSEVGPEYSVLSTPYPEDGYSELAGRRPQVAIPSSLPTPDSRPPAHDPLPLSALRLPDETLDLLDQLGIQRLDQLLALPRQSLRARFGERLLLRLDQFLGTAQETIVAHRPPPRFVVERVLEYPLERRDAIEQVVRELVEQIARDLAVRREGALRLTCRLDCAGGRPVLLEVGLFRPSAEAAHLGDLVQMRLEQVALPGPLGRVMVAAALAAPLENRQGELFAADEHEAARHLALFIDRCSSRLGPNAVLHPELTADPLPERAVRKGSGFRVQGSGKKSEVRGRRRGKKKERERGRGGEGENKRSEIKGQGSEVLGTGYSVLPLSLALHRPLALLAPPLPLEVVSVVPDGPPQAFRLAGKSHRLVRSWGPERIEVGWWRGRSVRRDYYRVETDAGCRYWIFRRLDDGQWHLHGDFG